jgi:hypothetical protein
MDGGSFHYILKGLVVLAALLFASASLIALWRLPGVFADGLDPFFAGSGKASRSTVTGGLGWLVVKRSLANFVCRFTSNRVRREIDLVYPETCEYRNGSAEQAVPVTKPSL